MGELMGYLLDKAQKEGDFTKYKKYLFIRVFFDVLLLVAILWSFYYTGSYYLSAASECIKSCPCLDINRTRIPAFGAWTNESFNITYNSTG